MDVSNHHKSVYVVCLISLLIQTAFSVFYSFAAIAVYVTWTPGNPCEFGLPVRGCGAAGSILTLLLMTA
jgi:hypothetical protein